MNLTKDRIIKIASKYVKCAGNALRMHCYDTAIRYTKAAAHTKYNFYLGFRDETIEQIIEKLASLLKKRPLHNTSTEKACVFFDSFSIDNGGLVQQYLSALHFAGYRISYITERIGFEKGNSAIKHQLLSYGNANIIEIPSLALGMKRCQYIYDAIMQVGAPEVFIHSSPSAICPVVAFKALPQDVIKYKINLTDHAFWVGLNSLDYSFEFRPRGCVLSECQRGIPHDRLFLIPFYPIQSKVPFQGFPEETKDKVVILSGGAYYKVFDKKNSFFKIVKSILETNPSAVMVFAGTGDVQKMNEKLKQFDLTDRFFLIGQRKDISEVYKHSDIFLNTAPLGGGLMCQLAAMYSKPILSFAEEGKTAVEELVCQRKKIEISHYSIDSLIEESKHLVNDDNYRNERGKAIHECAVDEEIFNQLFLDTINSGKNQVPYQFDEAYNYNHMNTDDKIDYENINKFYQRSIVKIFGLTSIWRCPEFFKDSIAIAIHYNKIKTVINNNLQQ